MLLKTYFTVITTEFITIKYTFFLNICMAIIVYWVEFPGVILIGKLIYNFNKSGNDGKMYST